MKTLLTYILPALIMCAAFSHLSAQPGYKFGLKKSMNCSRFTVDGIQPEPQGIQVTAPFATGNTHGMVFNFGFNESFSLQTGFELAITRYKLVLSSPGSYREFRSSYYAWSVPVLLTHRVLLSSSRNSGLYLRKSGGFSMLLLHPYLLQESGSAGNYSFVYTENAHAGFDATLNIGASLDFDISDGAQVFSLGISYRRGFRETIDGIVDYRVNGGKPFRTKGTSGSTGFSIDFIWFLPS